MPLNVGSRIAHYDVTALIGEGGMGQVYQATDTKLKRQVALKILPEAFSADPERLARFQREAEVLASLNHPNIAAIHGLEEADGTRALVLELVEGPTLADRIKRGAIPLDEALPIATQIAEALEAAHEAGVIHRDLKPANIKVREDGTVKVLDFGLAKAFQPDPSDPSLSQSPTISLTAAATQMGMVIGTAAYMAPEQAKGKVVDKRVDVWAFGAVLFEMLAGRKPFTGDDVSTTLARVIEREPDWDSLPSNLSPVLATYLRRCLEKEPKQRVHDIADVRLAMEGAFDVPAPVAVELPETPVTVPQLQFWQRPVPLVLVALVLVALTGLVVRSATGPTSPVPRVERFAIPPPAPETLGVPPISATLAISPDGTKVVYPATGGNPFQLYVRGVEELTATPLQGLNTQVFGPFFSPDGAWVGFDDEQDNTLKRVSILGGPAVTICNTGTRTVHGASWGEDNTIIFGTSEGSGLWRVPVSGGEPEEITTLEEGELNHVWPHFLPGGRAVLFTIQSEGSIENARIAVVTLDTNEQRVLVPGGSHPRYSPTGHLVYGVGGTLWAVGFDLDRLEVTDPNPVPLLAGVVTKSSGAVDFDLARDGSLVYVAGEATDVVGRTLVWVDRQGNEVPLDLPTGDYFWARVSPDETRLALTILGGPENPDVWIAELARGTLAKLTTDPAIDVLPLWTPDGDRVVFQSQREGPLGLFWAAADASGEVEPLLTIDDAVGLQPYGWTPDGSALVFEYSTAGTGADIAVLSMEGERTWEPLIATEANEMAPALSPDGQWIAYTSDETGQRLVYVERFPERGGKKTISRVRSADPMWSPDGRELFYLTGGGRSLMVVPVEPGPTLQVGEATLLFEGNYFDPQPLRSYDVSPDGQRFLRLKLPGVAATETGAGPEVILVQNWTEELKRLVPTE